MGARCSSWAIRCSRSTASVTRRSACSSARASMESATCASHRCGSRAISAPRPRSSTGATRCLRRCSPPPTSCAPGRSPSAPVSPPGCGASGRPLRSPACRCAWCAWLAVLRAPWCGASLATLTALSGPEDSQLLWEARADTARLARCAPRDLARLARVHEVLARALEQRDAAPAADWLEATWVQLGAPDAYPRSELRDARVFFSALAERAAAFEWRGPEDFPALLQDL